MSGNGYQIGYAKPKNKNNILSKKNMNSPLYDESDYNHDNK